MDTIRVSCENCEKKDSCKEFKRVMYGILEKAIQNNYAYFISGTRSTMLLPFFLFGVIGFYHFRGVKYFKYIMYPLIAISAAGFLAVSCKLIVAVCGI